MAIEYHKYIGKKISVHTYPSSGKVELEGILAKDESDHIILKNIKSANADGYSHSFEAKEGKVYKDEVEWIMGRGK